MSDDLPELLASEPIYNGHLFDVRRDTVRIGEVDAVRETIIHPGAVCMVPVDGDGNVHLVRQYRHAARARLLEVPAGTLEPGEEPETTAIRELQEEIGKLPGEVTSLGGFFVAPGYTSEYIWIYACINLSDSRLAGDDDEDIEVVKMPLSEAIGAIERGEIVDGKTIVALLRYASRNNE